jgi:hypothetical protein
VQVPHAYYGLRRWAVPLRQLCCACPCA